MALSHDFGGASIEAVFDGDPETTVTQSGVSEASIRLVFAEARALLGSAIGLSGCDSYEWRVTLADTEADMDSQSGRATGRH